MVRMIKKEDAEAVKSICADALGHKTETELIERRIAELSGDNAYYMAVYETDGTVSGFIQAERYDLLYGDRGWNIIALAVRPSEQGKGVGRALVESLERHCKNSGGAFVRLNSRIERTEAHGFYEHIGYECDKTQKRFIKYV